MKVNSKKTFWNEKKEVSFYKTRRIIRQDKRLSFEKKLREEGVYLDAQSVGSYISK